MLICDYAFDQAGAFDGLLLIECIKRSHTELRILMLTMHDDPALVRKLFGIGVRGFLCKANATFSRLAAAVRTVAADQRYIDPEVALALSGAQLGFLSRQGEGRRATLTKREYEVVRLFARHAGQRDRAPGVPQREDRQHPEGVGHEEDGGAQRYRAGGAVQGPGAGQPGLAGRASIQRARRAAREVVVAASSAQGKARQQGEHRRGREPGREGDGQQRGRQQAQQHAAQRGPPGQPEAGRAVPRLPGGAGRDLMARPSRARRPGGAGIAARLHTGCAAGAGPDRRGTLRSLIGRCSRPAATPSAIEPYQSGR
ncbi:hypothetical protein BGLA2_230006 [Burkholderia gladioli]|nr:hypothetical protein BGLA2_230006 [Burkholderia gladioli]